MPVINGVYLKDFTALPGAVADADIIPIAITGNQIAYRTTVAGIITNARITGKLLTGLSITGGAVVAADTILAAFGKVQNQINGINLALYVPYTGATGAVNLGAYDLTVNGIKVGIGAGSINTNTIVGASALNANTTGGVNTAIGRFALTANTEGNFNTAVGASSLIANTTGSSNSAFGYVSLTANTTGTFNSALGNLALTNNTTGAYNSAIGYSALAGNTTGSNNVGVGYTAGYLVNAGTDNITSGTSVYIGSDTRASASGNQNEIVIGYEGRGNGSNTVTIGNSSIANNYFIGNVRGGAFIKTGGTSAQFLKADGTVDSVSYGTGSVTSVGLSMPSAFSVASSPITTSGTIAVTGAGLASQYIRGDGALADFPTTGGGGSSVSYYLNGSVSQGTFVGNTYYEMNKTPVIGAGTDFSIGADGYIAQFITDANDPASLLIPGGNWNVEMYFSASSNGGTPSFYVEVYKYNGTTFTILGSSSATPEGITNGTAIDIYYTSVGIPETVLTITDRIAIRVYVTHSGRTITLHTEDNHLSEIVTTFSNGLTALNGLTKQVQYLAVGTAGTDFAISSSDDTHTFNIPDAGASARGLITTGTQTIAGFKTFSSTIKLTNGTSNGFSLESGTTGFYASLKAPAGLAADIIVTLPSATGTLALTSDLTGYLPLSGGTLTGALSGTSASFSSNNFDITGASVALTIARTTGSGFVGNATAGAYVNFYGATHATKANKVEIVAASGIDIQNALSGTSATFSDAVNISLANAANKFVMTSTTGTNAVYQRFSNSGGNYYIGADNSAGTGLFAGGGIAYGLGIVTESAQAIVLGTNNTARLTIASTGAATFSGDVNLTSNGAKIVIGSGSTGASYVRVDNNSLSSYFGKENSSGNAFFNTTVTAYSTVIAAYNSTAPIIFGHSNPELTISSAGDVLVAKTSADGTVVGVELRAIGLGIFTRSGGSCLQLNRNTSDGTIASFRTSDVERGSISIAGATTSYNTSSDYRLKEDLQEIKGLERVQAIKVYDYKWKSFDSRMDGVLAHELAEIIPYAVNGEKDEVDEDGNDKMQGVDYSKLVPIMIKAIQELKAEIDLLKGKPIIPTDNNLE